MKMYTIIGIIGIVFLFIVLAGSCRAQTSKYSLTVVEFAEKINELPDAPVIDVRTPSEFSQGHLLKSVNIDWQGHSFIEQITMLDKSKPVLIYCRSGRRSAEAAKKMRAEGFKEVYELNTGILGWKEAGYEEQKDD